MSKEVSPTRIRGSAKSLEMAADHLDDKFDAFLDDVRDVGAAAGDAGMVGQVMRSAWTRRRSSDRGVESVVDGVTGSPMP